MTLVESIAKDAGGSRECVLDADVFQAIYNHTAKALWVYLARVSGSRDLADDLLQETYCRFLVRYKRAPIRPVMNEAETRSYLFRIATNLLRDRWRRGDTFSSDEEMSETAGVMADSEVSLDVRRVMEVLAPRERQLLWLAYVEGMNHAEIATIAGLSAMSIRLLLFRARRKAAALLRPERMEKR